MLFNQSGYAALIDQGFFLRQSGIFQLAVSHPDVKRLPLNMKQLARFFYRFKRIRTFFRMLYLVHILYFVKLFLTDYTIIYQRLQYTYNYFHVLIHKTSMLKGDYNRKLHEYQDLAKQ
jgi:hypothetical protein